jgi:hypothetical protein
MDKYKILLIAIVGAFFTKPIYAADLYHCKQADGRMSYQDRPCEVETVKVEESGSRSSVLSQEHMLRVLAKMTGKTEEDLKDPKLRQAAEVLVATDAGKAYAFTKVYGVATEFCGPEVSQQLRIYEEKAHEVISLGKYYYYSGMYFQVGNKNISHSGKELTDALNKMLEKETKKYKYANRIKLDGLCKEATKALKSLAMVYSHG